jgi:hypothetical protein
MFSQFSMGGKCRRLVGVLRLWYSRRPSPSFVCPDEHLQDDCAAERLHFFAAVSANFGWLRQAGAPRRVARRAQKPRARKGPGQFDRVKVFLFGKRGGSIEEGFHTSRTPFEMTELRGKDQSGISHSTPTIFTAYAYIPGNPPGKAISRSSPFWVHFRAAPLNRLMAAEVLAVMPRMVTVRALGSPNKKA